MFEIIGDPDAREKAGSMEIDPDELIVGTLPPYSVGQGKELMRYLTDDETLYWELRYLNEWSPFGHIVPDHEFILDNGIIGILNICQEKQRGIGNLSDKKYCFYQSVIKALEGVLLYVNAYADLAEDTAAKFPANDEKHQNLQVISERLRKCPAQPCETFMEALQTIYIMHCALHFTGEIVSIGRLDQILYKYYADDIKEGRLTPAQAQEAIDCFWIKLDEKVVLNKRFIEDRFTSSDGALLGTGAASNFDQGALVNQWMQQVTIGGIKADNDAESQDATNEITFMCLEAARRLPLNSPTLDLRVHSKTDVGVLRSAAKAILSGGAHPILMNDDKIVPALHSKTGGFVELKSARNYACDGCYETLFAGETEFSFGFVSALDVLEKALNGGAGFGASGSTYLRGSKSSFRTKPAARIESFDEFWEILEKHLLLGCHKFLQGILTQYGIKENVSPSPLLSAMVTGCLEKGRDLAGGGARYRLFSPLMTGISTAADSLYIIKKLVFDEKLFTLEELVACLRSNWGRNKDVIGLKLPKSQVDDIRALCIRTPKFGRGVVEVDELAWKLIDRFYESIQEAKNHPVHSADWERLKQSYGEQDYDFEILFAPGVGTFEQYNFGGSFVGATPDGRYAFDPIASDFSPAPLYSDEQPVAETNGNTSHRYTVKFMDGLRSYTHDAVNLLSDGAPSDFNIGENFDEDSLVDILKSFAGGQGSNMLTITVADPETMAAAQNNPDEYELVRVRMGGWTEFFITLFPMHQEQHKRRPQFIS
ncbi:MAG TPA: pyruvate formate lyase family protein [Pyrinomonadaceae bacterium]|nr:pyruvate formate lyase family protein [Pyrinomonadaceae bacterium]